MELFFGNPMAMTVEFSDAFGGLNRKGKKDKAQR